MRNANSFRRYATATGLLLIFLVVGLWASGMLANEVRAEAEPGFSTTADEFPFLPLRQHGALLPARVLRMGCYLRGPCRVKMSSCGPGASMRTARFHVVLPGV